VGGVGVKPYLMPDEPPDEYDGYEEFVDHQQKTSHLASSQAAEAREFVAKVQAGGYLRMPWPDLDRLVGPILGGFLMAVGGRGKAGKTTLLRDCFTAWTEMGKKIVYVGTETEASILRLAWAAIRCGVPVETAIDPYCPKETMEKLLADVDTQTTGPLSYTAIFGDCANATVSELHKWVRYAEKSGADALIFDHFHRLDVGTGEQWQGQGNAVRAIKNMAKTAQLPIVMGAQLTQGEGGSWLGEHEIPGNKSWAGTSSIQREVDIGIQVWRPFKPGITAEQKRLAREDYTKVQDLVQQNVMGIRVAAHRWKGASMNQCTKLYVEQDQLHSYSARTEARDTYAD
jgi:hypothetical protein